MAVVSVADVQRMFTEFAASYPDLRLYRSICEGAAADDQVAGLLLAARPGQARPVLFLAALHDLVLRRPDVPAGRWYPSATGEPVPDGDPWPDVRRTCLDHAEELRAVIATRATQTNEVNRVVPLAPLLAQVTADAPGAPVALVEMGTSAGLLLGLDRYRIEITPPGDPGPVVLGDPASTVVCAGVQRSGSSLAGLSLPLVASRVGLDLAPVSLDDADGVRWLEACLWPDVPGRLERFRAAVDLLRADPPSVVAGDMVDDLEAVAHAARAVAAALIGAPPGHQAHQHQAHKGPRSSPGSDERPRLRKLRRRRARPSWFARSSGSADQRRSTSGRSLVTGPSGSPAATPDLADLIDGSTPIHLVVFSSWALTYVARDRRSLVTEALATLATDGRPVSWLTAESPGCVPGIPGPTPVEGDGPPTDESTVLGARRWRDGVELAPARWGTSHPHGTSLTWTPTP